MERSLLQEITNDRLSAYLKRTQFDKRYWPSFFPLQYRDELTWETLQGEEGAAIKADIVSYNSSAPEKGREIIGKASGKITKTTVKRSMREEDFLMYRRLKKGAANAEQKRAILDMVFNDVDFVVNAVLASCEYMSLQAASTGQLTLDKTNNNGLITETAINMGIPSGNKSKVSIVLSDKDSFDFISEVKVVKAAAKKKSVGLNYMFMDEDTLDAILNTKKVKEAYGYLLTSTKGTYEGDLFLDDLNGMMRKYRLPQIIPVSSLIRHEDRDHKRSTLDPWKPGYITFTV
ncbi:MAG: major capsid protein, partial [Dysgonamonadaceae bacterium]|nr:major capsid protein [Dysgonamonadaceae bacterium]